MIEPGTPYIGLGQPNLRKLFWKYAGLSGLPIVVLWKSPNTSKDKALIGLWKLLSNTRTNGFLRNGGVMETHTAQGFLRLLLTEDEAQTIIHCARKAGRYLIPFEVSRILKKDIKQTVTDVQERRMEDTWLAFCKETNSDQRTGCTDPETLEQWFNYVAKEYHEPLPEASPWDN